MLLESSKAKVFGFVLVEIKVQRYERLLLMICC